MENNPNPTNIEDFDSILPSGWTENDDIFAPDTWGKGEETADAQPDTPDPDIEQMFGQTPEENPTTDEPGAEQTEDNGDPTTDTADDERVFEFTARVDKKDVRVKLTEAELPTIWQQAQNMTRMQKRYNEMAGTMRTAETLARQMGYESAEAMLKEATANYKQNEIDRLVGKGVDPEVAEEFFLSRSDRTLRQSPIEEEPEETEAQLTSSQIQIQNNVDAFFSEHPGLRTVTVPDAVIKATLADPDADFGRAYRQYLSEQEKEKAANLRRENQILKQNAEARSRSPVRSVNGANPNAPKNALEDALLKGFDSASY